MTGLKRWGFRRLGGKRGFTLIELLIVMVILAILAGIVVVAVGGVLKTAEERAYDSEKEVLRTATMAYYTSHGMAWPSNNSITITGCTDCEIIDMCKLLDPPGTGLGYIDIVPTSCTVVDGDNNDNCDLVGCGNDTVAPITCTSTGALACNCSTTSHYIWAVSTADGTIHSANTEDNSPYTDGFRGADTYP